LPLLCRDVARLVRRRGRRGDGMGDWSGSVMGAVETVVGGVRELIRRTGVDPLKDESTIRQLVRDAVGQLRSHRPRRVTRPQGLGSSSRAATVCDAMNSSTWAAVTGPDARDERSGTLPAWRLP
jgi:hypothetical protein